MRQCPICGRIYNDPPALSRADNHTEICPTCGLSEALEDFLKATGIETAELSELIRVRRQQIEG